MITRKKINTYKVKELIEKYPFLIEFIESNLFGMKINQNKNIEESIHEIDEEILEDKAIDLEEFILSLVEFTNQMIEFLGIKDTTVNDITIISGFNKLGEKEGFDNLTIKKGEIIAIVGPTGSGKSRLLADIEWGAQKDTPTKRTVLINGEILDPKTRFSSSNKLVAQLSQNMNFVIDLSVGEFIELHANSRLVENPTEVIEKIFKQANDLAGESFSLTTPITSLSGGQSRALMIADTAILSSSPIVLIDEIENAGIDRKKALDLLIGNDKIVLMSTHDPILALMADKRIIISNGGIDKVMTITDEEKNILFELQKLDLTLQDIRNKLRFGKKLELKK